MNRDLLYRFFEGKTTVEEEKKIRQWVDSSEANHSLFFKERITYDALLLTPRKKGHRKQHSLWVISTAAAVLLLLIVSGLYLFEQKQNEELFNKIIVPPGQRINLILSDNSNVWLNANTTFRYPARFSKKERDVYLDGEAYFEVTNEINWPFIVKTDKGSIRVTGTRFNVEAYSEYNTFETSLFEGGVDIYVNHVKLVSLNPNQKSSLEGDHLLLSHITDTDEYLWREGLIAFKNKRLDEIFASLEKYFNVTIRVNPEKLPQHTYTGKFRQSDGVDYALRVLQKSIHFEYGRDVESEIIDIK